MNPTDEEQITKQDYEELKAKVDSLDANVQELLNLWEQARGMLNFIKFIGALGAAIGGFLVFIKPYVK